MVYSIKKNTVLFRSGAVHVKMFLESILSKKIIGCLLHSGKGRPTNIVEMANSSLAK